MGWAPTDAYGEGSWRNPCAKNLVLLSIEIYCILSEISLCFVLQKLLAKFCRNKTKNVSGKRNFAKILYRHEVKNSVFGESYVLQAGNRWSYSLEDHILQLWSYPNWKFKIWPPFNLESPTLRRTQVLGILHTDVSRNQQLGQLL